MKCGGNGGNKPVPPIDTVIIKHDTIQVTKDSLIKSKPKFIKGDSIPYAMWDTIFLPDTNYEKLRQQYLNNTRELLSKNYYVDSIAYDSNNYVKIWDTIQLNKLHNRSVQFNLMDLIIHDSVIITRTIKPVNQVYFGLGILGNKVELVKGIEASLMLKTKKDNIYEIKTQHINNQVIYGIGTKWKIKF
jgi:hypothetical protein